GYSLRNRVAIVGVRSAHLNAKNHPVLVLVAIVCAGYARVCSNFVIWKAQPIFGGAKDSANREKSLSDRKK
ncbi:MAG: hypothetical protein IKH02_04665, partial [Prevotella sp.]|nr:hypothetical protein [Prevotella sp.]